jgi:hypothetical protein
VAELRAIQLPPSLAADSKYPMAVRVRAVTRKMWRSICDLARRCYPRCPNGVIRQAAEQYVAEEQAASRRA